MTQLIIALDFDSGSAADDLMAELRGLNVRYKVGLELTTSIGVPVAVAGFPPRTVMLDLKLHDIPATMVKAIEAAARFPAVWGVTLHASAGKEALEKCMTRAHALGVIPIVITALTSLSDEACRGIYGVTAEALAIENARRVDLLQLSANRPGLVCSPHEIRVLRTACPRASIITPGVRPEWYGDNDQKRTATPKQASADGADFIVVGRPITQPVASWSRRRAAEAILAELVPPKDHVWSES